MTILVSPAGRGNSHQLPVRNEWLRLRSEPVLEADRQIVDAHHHLLDNATHHYLWPDLAEDLKSGHRITATVFIPSPQSMYRTEGPMELRPVGECEYAASVARESKKRGGETEACAGIVAFADLTLGKRVVRVLEALRDASGGRLRGIRNNTAWHVDPGIQSNPYRPPQELLLDPAFQRGAQALARLDLCLDVWVYQTQLHEVYRLATALPGLTVVLDHLGGPLAIGAYAGRKAEAFAEWLLAMKRLASLPNVRVKLGGLGMRTVGFDFQRGELPPDSARLAAAWRPWIEPVIEMFGAARCMFESNFPIDKGSCGYVEVWNAFKRITAAESEATKHDLFMGTAARTYRLTST